MLYLAKLRKYQLCKLSAVSFACTVEHADRLDCTKTHDFAPEVGVDFNFCGRLRAHSNLLLQIRDSPLVDTSLHAFWNHMHTGIMIANYNVHYNYGKTFPPCMQLRQIQLNNFHIHHYLLCSIYHSKMIPLQPIVHELYPLLLLQCDWCRSITLSSSSYIL